MEQQLKRAKRKQLLTIVVISVLTTLIVAAGGYIAINRATTHQAGKVYQELNDYHTVKEPNVELASEMLGEHSAFGGSIVTQEYKDLDGQIIKWQKLTSTFTPWSHQLDSAITATNMITQVGKDFDTSDHRFNADSGQKLASFFTRTSNLPNEAKQLPDGLVGEVALTFTKPLTAAQVRALLPNNVALTWGYLFSDNAHSNGELPGVADPVGIAWHDRDSLTYWQNSLRRYWGDFKQPTAMKQALKAKPKTLRFAGVMVTGKSSALRALANIDGIAGTSIGATAKAEAFLQPSDRPK